MKFTRTVTVTQVRRKIALSGTGLRCPRCGCELGEKPETVVPEKTRKLPSPGDKKTGEKDETGRIK